MSPNPFQDKISFNLDTPILKIEVCDLLGRKIASPEFQLENENVTVDLSKIIEIGIYLIKIFKGDGKCLVEKIIKK
ncbi:MAG: T9SS type A sorting domain-containing protein [Burkholderiales bacterium]|nr:T9SS type A sorting domain-containing protein [Flavobacterium sp.]